MATELVTRTEYSRSIEDADKYRALHTLQEVGLLVPVAELETYHGRMGARDESVDWAVNPAFANGGNDSGNGNVNNRPTLYTGERQVAQDFARERVRETVRPLYEQIFEERVRGYSPQQKQQWLARLNKHQQERWDGMPLEQRRLFKQAGPTVYAWRIWRRHIEFRLKRWIWRRKPRFQSGKNCGRRLQCIELKCTR